ncbi:MAG TPA: acyl carrier protein [Chryseolinea sp.]|mgnify:CR=1 FL=1|nr:acyl carrier protein [Chryseolinea sp.]HPH46057.1 acyl carrier protein [Chryseolinea sp.]HPM30115.1 acyl carrier protein [Chryseolinea sp.]
MDNLKSEGLAQELCRYIESNIVDKSIQVQPDTSLAKIGIDSLAIIELVLFLERKFKITLPEKELVPENFISANTLANCAVQYANPK